MPTQIWIAIGALSLVLPMLAWALFSRPSRAHQHAVANLQRGMRPAAEPTDPVVITVSGARKRPLVFGLIPARSVARVDRLAARAGRPASWPVERALTAKLL